MFKNYILIILGLLLLLTVNSYFNLNSKTYVEEIKNAMTYQTFKDLKTNINKEKTNDSLTQYIEVVLGRNLEKRNKIAGDMVAGNIFAIFFVCIIGGLHYLIFIFKNNNSKTIMRLSIVISIIWILIFFAEFNVIGRFSNIKGFIIVGLVPPVLLIGLQWVKLSIIQKELKNK